MDLLILPAVEADFTLRVQPSVTIVLSPKDSDFVVAVSIIEQVTDPIIAPLPDQKLASRASTPAEIVDDIYVVLTAAVVQIGAAYHCLCDQLFEQ